MAEDLSAPLKRRSLRSKSAAARIRRGFPVARSLFALLLVLGLGLAARVMLVDEPSGGRPSAEVGITATHEANPVATDVAIEPLTPLPEATTPAVPSDGPAIITMGGDGAGITVLGAASDTGTPMQLAELVEQTPTGSLPRRGADGLTPFAAYARPSVTPQTAGGVPLIAIVMTGLGLNEAGTLDAIQRLPPEISFAFAPYGRTLDVTVPAARAQGHELLLQVPLEPFDYPTNDPGPQTLLSGQPARSNLDKLYWLLARMGGYVGVMNYMGARFTSSSEDFAPVMEELGLRGLGYLDDGSSNRAIAAQLAGGNKVPFGRADVVIDANPAPEPIRAALDALVQRAAANGSAIGVISALPVSITTLAEWTKTLDSNRVVLVPASALMTAPQ